MSAFSVPNRAFCEALICQRHLTVPEIDAYADRLANEHWQTDTTTRMTLCAAMTAYLDGWLAGYERGLAVGIEAGETIARRTHDDTEQEETR